MNTNTRINPERSKYKEVVRPYFLPNDIVGSIVAGLDSRSQSVTIKATMSLVD